jgi:hypothetical protein
VTHSHDEAQGESVHVPATGDAVDAPVGLSKVTTPPWSSTSFLISLRCMQRGVCT